MSADELLPLPEGDAADLMERIKHYILADGIKPSYVREALENFYRKSSRANVAHATAGLRAEWRSLGVCAVAAENASVAEYCRHWEGRAERAEAELAAAREDAARLREAAKMLEIKWRSESERGGGLTACIEDRIYYAAKDECANELAAMQEQK